MKRSKTFYISVTIVSAILLSLLILGTIFDLQISQLFVNIPRGSYYSNNIFAIIGETFGENILYVLLEISFVIMFYYFARCCTKSKWLNAFVCAFFAVCGVVVCFYCINKTLNYLSIYTNFGLDVYLANQMGKLSVFAFSVVVNVVTFLSFYKISNESIKQLVGFALCVMVVSLISNAIVQGSKYIFCRTRFRAMLYEGYDNFEYFTNWYQINTNKFASTSEFYEDYFKSFPSGHTCAAASSFLLILLPSFYSKTNTLGWKITFSTFAGIYTFLVALSRIVAGAHYLTDVLVGGLVTIICVFITKWFVVDKMVYKTKQKILEESKK